MSRHDPILAWLRENATATPFLAKVAEAFEEEIRAHDHTRTRRNEATKRAESLAGNVRGLETRVRALEQAEPRVLGVGADELRALWREMDELKDRIAAARNALDGRERDSAVESVLEDRVSE